MSPEKLAEILHERISEFGEKPSYVLFPEELLLGEKNNLLSIQEVEDRGDGTTITKAVFEGKVFLCVQEKEGRDGTR